MLAKSETYERRPHPATAPVCAARPSVKLMFWPRREKGASAASSTSSELTVYYRAGQTVTGVPGWGGRCRAVYVGANLNQKRSRVRTESCATGTPVPSIRGIRVGRCNVRPEGLHSIPVRRLLMCPENAAAAVKSC